MSDDAARSISPNAAAQLAANAIAEAEKLKEEQQQQQEAAEEQEAEKQRQQREKEAAEAAVAAEAKRKAEEQEQQQKEEEERRKKQQQQKEQEEKERKAAAEAAAEEAERQRQLREEQEQEAEWKRAEEEEKARKAKLKKEQEEKQAAAAAAAAAAGEGTQPQSAAAVPPPVPAPAPAASSPSSNKKQRPPISAHPNGHDALLCSNAYSAHWLSPEHVVIGSGGGGRRYEQPNMLILLHVPTSRWHGTIDGKPPNAAKDDGEDDFPDAVWETVQMIEFEEAGTITAIAEAHEVVMDAATGKPVVYFVLAHSDSFSVIRFDPNNNSRDPMSVVCRVAVVHDLLDPDSKVVAVCNGLIFVAQDNATIAVYRLSTLLQWAKQESALTKQPAVAATTNNQLTMCTFGTGGRVCDLQAMELSHQQQQQHSGSSQKASNSGSSIVLSLCGRDKVLRVGTFDVAAHDFVPLNMFGAADLGFNGPNVAFSGRSIRTSAFSPIVRNEFGANSELKGEWNGATLDLFVAVQPLRQKLHAAHIVIRAVPRRDENNDGKIKPDATPKITAACVALCASEESSPPATAAVVPTPIVGDINTTQNCFLVATSEGSLIEFVFPWTSSPSSSNLTAAAGGSISSNGAYVRRSVRDFHYDAVMTKLAFSPPSSLVGNVAKQNSHAERDNLDKWKETRICVSTDISKRVAFHTWDPRSRCRTMQLEWTSVEDKRAQRRRDNIAKLAPDLFIQDEAHLGFSPAKIKQTVVKLAAVSFVLLVLSFILSWIWKFIF